MTDGTASGRTLRSCLAVPPASFPTALATCLLVAPLVALAPSPLPAQAYGEPDRGSPGDAMIQAWLAADAERLDGLFLEGIASAADWEAARPRYREEYLYMLGLWPLPERTPLEATVTGTLDRDGYAVEKLHYQSRPGLYVTANLYRPSKLAEGERLPAVLYLCGHSGRGRNGNKTAFQSHGIWFARHGYVCLVLDTLQLGEIAGIHHGTYREGRWWWLARGYTPAGVECHNGIRGIDYLQGRPDVDPERIAVTGISGGGAATFWIAAADERVRVAVPVSGMADLESYVSNRVIDGHCDCMFLHNAFRWPWTRIAGLIAPRPLLFVNSHRDPIFPMDANARVMDRLEMLYALFGAGDRVDAVVSLGGHAYREDIRKAAYRSINLHLEGDPREVADSEVDLVVEEGGRTRQPIAPEDLRVFPRDEDIPADQRNTTADRWFVPQADVAPPVAGAFAAWKDPLLRGLRRVTFGALPDRVPPARLVGEDAGGNGKALPLETEVGIHILAEEIARPGAETARAVILVVDGLSSGDLESLASGAASVFSLQPRGTGETRWTSRSPPNYVERSHVLLGTTADTGRIRDIVAAARFLKERSGATVPVSVQVAGRGAGAVLAAYAALLEDDIEGAILLDPPASLMQDGAPRLLNALRVCDVPDVIGMLAPRPLRLRTDRRELAERVRVAYEAAGAAGALEVGPP